MTDETKKVVLLPKKPGSENLATQNDFLYVAHQVAVCCAAADLTYERMRIRIAKEIGVRPKFLDDRRKQAIYKINLSYGVWDKDCSLAAGDPMSIDQRPAFIVAAFRHPSKISRKFLLIEANAEVPLVWGSIGERQ